MWLVICSPTDHAAHWAYQQLRRAGLDPVELVAADALAMSFSFEHRLDQGGLRTRLRLPSGLELDSDVIAGVLNRIRAVPGPHVYLASPADRDYALMELNALWLSWLYALPAPVLNRPSPLGLCGAVRHPSEWRALAARAGLDPAPYRLAADDPAALRSPWEGLLDTGVPAPAGGACCTECEDAPDARKTVLVIGEEVFGDGVPTEVRRGCVALARQASLRLMEAEFTTCGGSWRFLEATPWPDLRRGGAPAVSALCDALTAEREEGA